jgi:hypothetical protein|tara:strand:+ start:566 stop:706 length:141 start_codon:yes stop_codon:yes gene_type:complete
MCACGGGGGGAMAEHVLQPSHADGLVEYTRFLRKKREQARCSPAVP